FFQAEDGIRSKLVTGVQTCALPISRIRPFENRTPLMPYSNVPSVFWASLRSTCTGVAPAACSGSMSRCVATFTGSVYSGSGAIRSEERRVGKEWGGRLARNSEKEKK